MGDQTETKPVDGQPKLDLSSLNSLSLGPDWVSQSSRSHQQYRFADEGDGGRGRRGERGSQRDRRGPGMRREGGDGRAEGERARSDSGSRVSRFGQGGGRGQGGERGRGGRPDRAERHDEPEVFSPVVEVDFYPEEEPFKVLTQAIRTSFRTFELFEIARLILDKPERFVCVLRDPEQREGEPARLYACVVDGLPFRTEDEALKHVFRHYLGEFFEIETVEGEPPSGVFTVIHKCGMTGELISPPNYHRYRALCREHHAAKLAHVPYERFEQRLETSKEVDDIQAWLEKMKRKTRYTLKTDPAKVFETLEDARLHLLTHAKEQLVRPAWSARFSGRNISLLNPGDPIRRSVEFHLEGQRRFPLDTANHLRGRLRRMHFAVYKRGSKGISFVCAVKRRFRKPTDVLADNLQELIDFLEAHPNFPAKDLPKAYLGIELVKTEPEASAAATAADGPQAEAPVVTIKPPTAEITLALRQLKTDLHYLVSEGYVIEFSDGRLYVPPPIEDDAPKDQSTPNFSKPAEEVPEAAQAGSADEVVKTGAAAAEQAAAAAAESAVESAGGETVEDGAEPLAADGRAPVAAAESLAEPVVEVEPAAAGEEPESEKR